MRVDELFSNWIVLWYIFYYIGIIPYSPKLAIMISLFHNIILLILMIINRVRIISFIQFFFLVFITKVIPFILLINVSLKVDDVIFTLIIFNIYLVWIRMNGKDMYDIIVKSKNSMVGDKGDTPMMYLFRKIENYLKDIRIFN